LVLISADDAFEFTAMDRLEVATYEEARLVE